MTGTIRGGSAVHGCSAQFLGGLWLVLLITIGVGLPNSLSAAGLGKRPSTTTLRMPLDSTPDRYRLENAFGDLTFTYPVNVVSPPGDNRIFVVEQGGNIMVISDPANPTARVFLDISGRISYGRPEDEGGILGLAFHPNYEANGHFFVYYLCNTTTADGSGRHNRLSRFTRSRNDPNRADSGSEVILFSQYDEKFNHNGGALMFGPDGYLYVSLGDEGHPDDMFDNAQHIDKDFFSGVIRIDVDNRPGNLRPNAHPALKGETNYRVPNDNPYVGATSFNGRTVNPARVRTEFYAVGLRSPWRLYWDLPSSTLYVSDVGENSGEEFNVIYRGENYGWPYRLANEPGPKADQAPAGFASMPPLLTYERGDSGPFVGRAAIGGVVYRGGRLPELNGAYICGDYFSGNIWMVLHSGNSLQQWEHLTTMPRSHLVSFGIDPSNGDVLVCDILEGQVKRLVASGASGFIPQALSETGAFADLGSLTPNPGIVPYDVNAPFWSDGAIKRRWLSIMDPAAKIRSHRNGYWEFPESSVFIKHFELETVTGDPNSRRRVETRFLVRSADGVYGVTYKWNDAQTDAFLVGAGGDFASYTVNDNGTVRQQTWRFPSRSECLTCHNSAAGHVLGVNGPQMNRRFDYGNFTASQIAALRSAGYFQGGASAGKRLTDPMSNRGSLDARARSYLAANCAHCHRPGGPARSSWDARHTTPTSRAGIVNGGLTDNLGDPQNRVVAPKSPDHSVLLQRMITGDGGRRMPPIGNAVTDARGVELLTQWINSMPKRTVPLSARITAPRGSTQRNQIVTLSGTAAGDNLARVVYRLNEGAEQVAVGTVNWSAELILAPGVNRIEVYAENGAGERSRPARRTVRYVDPR
jgi:uncharacterized repeat protein (TIGR03806 family)